VEIEMPKPRSQQISLLDTQYYHSCSRTVRKAFLCGIDKESGVSYEHRRTWIEKRLFQLAQVLAIDICAHAIMHNHLHLVLHVDCEQINTWSTEEVLRVGINYSKAPISPDNIKIKSPLIGIN